VFRIKWAGKSIKPCILERLCENRKYVDGHVYQRADLADELFSWNSQLKVRIQKPVLYLGAVHQE
jgi:hypothetical protein